MESSSLDLLETSVASPRVEASDFELRVAARCSCIVMVFAGRTCLRFVARVVRPRMSKLNERTAADNAILSRHDVGNLDR